MIGGETQLKVVAACQGAAEAGKTRSRSASLAAVLRLQVRTANCWQATNVYAHLRPKDRRLLKVFPASATP